MIWKQLVKIALLGTERSTLTAEMQAALRAKGINTDQEITKTILEAVAYYAPLQKAGWQPKEWTGQLLPPSKEINQLACSNKSRQHLATILEKYPKLIPEFIEGMQVNKKCIPPELLPPLFEKSLKDESLWRQLENRIGERGKWLLPLNPAWSKLRSDYPLESWNTGSKEIRLSLLKKKRQTNPTEGLALLESTWKTDSVKEKAPLLKTLSIGLSMKDEAFLEECLNYKRKEIRTIAKDLLIQLPESQLHQRLESELTKLVTFVKKEETILLSLPEASNKALIRDGIDPKKKGASTKEEVNMLAQMMEIVAPSFWEKHFKTSPSQIIKLFANSDRSLFLVNAIIKAIALHQSKEWIAAIVQFWYAGYLQENWQALDMKPIFEAFPNDLFNELVYKRLQATKVMPDEHAPLMLLLQIDQQKWSKPVSLVVMQLLQDWIRRNPSFSYSGMEYRNLLKNQAAYAIDSSLHPKMSELWLVDQRGWAGWESDIQRFLNTLSFRRAALIELAK